MKYFKAAWRAAKAAVRFLNKPALGLWYGGFLFRDAFALVASYPQTPHTWLFLLNLVMTPVLAIWFTWDAVSKLRKRKVTA